MEEFSANHDGFRSTCAQVVATLAFNCLSVNLGVIIGMPSLVIGALRLNETTLKITEEEASWLGGLIFIVQPLGSVVSGFLQDLLGRKTCMMVVNVPQLVAWLLIYNAQAVSTLFIAVIILGISLGFMEAPVLSYVGEISEPRLRGVLSMLGGIFFNIGLLLEMLLGATMDWRTMALVDALGPVLALLALSQVPDSPAWLVSKGRHEDARKAYQWLRGWVSPEAVQEELDALVHYIEKRNIRAAANGVYREVPSSEAAEKCEPVRDTGPPQSQLKFFLDTSVQRPFRLIVFFFFISTCSSLSALRPFILEFMEKLNLPIESHWVLVIGSCLTLLGALTSIMLLPRTGKRGLTFISLGLSVACCYALSLYLALRVHLPWIPLLIFCISFYAAPLGIIFVPWILISELFPLRVRGLAGGISAALGYTIIFLVIKTYYSVVSLLTVPGACVLYGLVGTFGLVYLYYNLPETEGVPLEEIERLYSGRRGLSNATSSLDTNQ